MSRPIRSSENSSSQYIYDSPKQYENLNNSVQTAPLFSQFTNVDDTMAVTDSKIEILDTLYSTNISNIKGEVGSIDNQKTQELKALLSDWDQEHLVEHFVAEKVFVDVLMVIKYHHVEPLLKDFHMGTQIMFEHKLEEWRQCLGKPLVYHKCILSSLPPSQLPPTTLPSTANRAVTPMRPTPQSNPDIGDRLDPPSEDSDISLSRILSETPKAAMLVGYYNKFAKFQDEQRTTLINLIAQYFEDRGIQITLSMSYKLEKEIINRFPTEKLEYYRSCKRGRIYNKFCNLRTSFKSVVGKHIAEEVPKVIPEKKRRLEKDFVDCDTMGDQVVEKLLEEWNFEYLIPIFKEQEIDKEAFLQLTEELVKEIIPIIGRRIRFMQKLRQYQQIHKSDIIFDDNISIAETNTDIETTDIEQIPTTSVPSNPLPKESHSLRNVNPQSKLTNPSSGEIPKSSFQILAYRNSYHIDLEHLLQRTSPGKCILNYYRKQKTLDRRMRNLLVELIVKEAINDTDKLTAEDFENFSLKICELFPTETKATYYIPYVAREIAPAKKPIGAKGKLIDKYRNLRRTYNFINNSGEPQDCSSNVQEPDEHLRDSKEWLKINTEPWSEVLHHWKLTHGLRKSYAQNTVYEFINDWPILKTNDGQILIEEAFNAEFNCENALFVKWETCFEKILNSVKSTNREVNDLIQLLNPNLTDDSRTFIQFCILTALLPPTARIKSKDKRYWKPSVLESRESFILHVTTTSDIDLNMNKRKEKCAHYGLTVQPYIIVVGSSLEYITSSYMIIDENIYKISSVLKAVDICFKTFHVFNTPYPKESEQIWLFLQKGIYDVDTAWDVKIPAVESFITELQLN